MEKVFLSFSYDDVDRAEELKHTNKNLRDMIGFIRKTPNISIDSKEADMLKIKIIKKIHHTQITLCLVGENTYKNEWVNWELERSDEAGNRIVAMAAKGVNSAILPKLLKEKRLPFYNWSPGQIRGLIKDE